MFFSKAFPPTVITAFTFLHLASAYPQAAAQVAGEPVGIKPAPDGSYGVPFSISGTNSYVDGCKPQNGLNISITDVHNMALAGLKAAAHLDQPPLNYFFIPQFGPYVTHVLTRLVHFLENPQDVISSVNLDCNNPALCNAGRDPKSTQLGATKHFGLNETKIPGHTSWVVSLCPYAQEKLKASAPACTSTTPGAPTLGWVMAKQLLQMSNIVEEIYDRVSGPVACHNLTVNSLTDPTPNPGKDSTTNAESYAYFMQWALDLGYGEPEGKQCVGKWSKTPQDVVPAFAIREGDRGFVTV
ncbi:MAG: hypothetical protein Q9170_002885 [Blastenia crenularia]